VPRECLRTATHLWTPDLRVCLTNKGRGGIDDETLCQALSLCASIDSLYLGWTDVTDKAIKAVAASCPLLQLLDVSYTEFTDASMLGLAAGCPLLTSLNLKGTQVTDKGIKAVTTSCSHLKSIDVSKANISVAGIASIMAKCTELTSLGLGCLAKVPHQNEKESLKVIANARLPLMSLDFWKYELTDDRDQEDCRSSNKNASQS